MNLVLLGGKFARKVRVAAALDGARRLGWKVIPVDCDDRKALEDVLIRNPREDLFVLTSGTREDTRRARNLCAARGVPVAILDLGYFRRATGPSDPDGYNQMGWNRNGWIPGEIPDPARWNDLGLEILPDRPPLSGGNLLVLGQVPNDGQHGLYAAQLLRRLGELLKVGRAMFPEAGEAVYRPHPLADARDCVTLVPRWRHRWASPSEQPLGDALAEASAAVTWNSTAGCEAVRTGLPVVCSREAHYFGVSTGTVREREEYLRRLAWAQFTVPELRDGWPLEFLSGNRPA